MPFRTAPSFARLTAIKPNRKKGIEMEINYYKGLSVEYSLALVRANDASKTFRIAQEAYRSRKIGDAEFLAAKALHDAAQNEFDAAFAKESAKA